MKRRVHEITDGWSKANADGFRRLAHLFDEVNNNELHPSPWSLGRVLRMDARTAPDGSEIVMKQFRVGHEPDLCDPAVRNAWWAYVMFLGLLHEIFELPAEPFERVRDRGAKTLGLTPRLA